MIEKIENDGYVILDAFTFNHINLIKSHINHYAKSVTGVDDIFSSILDDENHAKIQEKKQRLFPIELYEALLRSNFLELIEGKLDINFHITDEENFGLPELYWRYVRPGRQSDVGPLHDDGWFCDINPNWLMPDFAIKRLKVWGPIQEIPGKSGLIVVPKSHKEPSNNYIVNNIGGKNKPSIKREYDEGELLLLDIKVGQCVIFHDRLLHGGCVTAGDKPRVSFEFTLAI